MLFNVEPTWTWRHQSSKRNLRFVCECPRAAPAVGELAAQPFFCFLLRRTFNPADYAEPAQTEENYGGGSTWNNTGTSELEEGTRGCIC